MECAITVLGAADNELPLHCLLNRSGDTSYHPYFKRPVEVNFGLNTEEGVNIPVEGLLPPFQNMVTPGCYQVKRKRGALCECLPDE